MKERRNPEGTAGVDAGIHASSVESGGMLPVAACAAAWDPYDVWLKRVKQPRDARVRKAPAIAAPSDELPAGTTQAAAMAASSATLSLVPTR